MNITLQAGNTTAAVRSLGGEIVSFVKDGTEYIWQGIAEHWSGQTPVLFPVCCAAKDNKMAFDGKEYPMPKHGIARKREFEPIYMSKDKVVYEQRATEETLTMFPFYYSLKTEVKLSENGYRLTYIVKNLDKNEMTFCIGGHPGFNCPIREEDGGFEDYSLIFDDAEGAVVSLTKDGYMNSEVPKLDMLRGTNEISLKYSDFDNDAIIIENLPKKVVKLVSRKTGKGFKFDFTGFDAIGLWTPIKKNSPFICLEPWNGLPADVAETTDAKSKKYSITLAPGEEYSVGYTFEVID